MPTYDFNVLSAAAADFYRQNRFRDSLKIFLFIAVIDTESGFYSERVGSCYENIGDLHSAKYWYGKAVKENPTIEPYVRARERLKHVNIDFLLDPKSYIK